MFKHQTTCENDPNILHIMGNSVLKYFQVVALESGGTGVTCNAICPGYVDTPCKYSP